MRIYTTRKGRQYDLTMLPRAQAVFVEQAAKWYQEGIPFPEFTRLVLGTQSPVLRQHGAIPPTKTPIYDIITDMQLRLGVKQGALAKDWEGEVDPDWQP